MGKFKISPTLAIFLAILWFSLVSFITVHTEYHNALADMLSDPRGTSTPLETALRVVIVVVSFVPSGFLLANIAFNRKNKYSQSQILLAALIIALALYVPFSWYYFATSFSS